jgi:hypothetical protein
VNIEFIDPVLPSRRAWSFVAGLGALAAVLFAAGRIMEARTAAIENEASARAATAALVQATPRAVPPPYAEDLKRALDRAALPEAVVLKELETVAVVGIQLTSIDIDMAEHRATVELQAEDDKALGEYLDQLNAGMPTPVWHIERLASTSSMPAAQGSATGVLRASVQNVTLKRRF